ncbi:MAG: YdbH domain-containing protein [Desulfobacterales bacterium]
MKKKTPTPFRLRQLLWPTLALVSLLAAVALAGYLLLATAAERTLLPGFLKAAGIQEHDVPVRRLGIFGADLGTLRIGPETAPGITAVSLSATFTPSSLLRRRIPRLSVEGLRIRVREGDDGRFEIPGIPTVASSPDSGVTGGPEPIPVHIAEIVIRQGELIVQRQDGLFRFPFEATITASPDMTAFDGAATVALADRWVAVRARVDMAGNRMSADWNGQGIPTDRLVDMAGLEDRLSLSGALHSEGRLQARLSPFQAETVEMTFRQTPCRLIWNDVRLDLSGTTPAEDLSITVTSDHPMEKWIMKTASIRAAGPGCEGLFTLNGTVVRDNGDGIRWMGHLSSTLSVVPGPSGIPPVTLPLELQTEATLSTDGQWRASLEQTGEPSPGQNLLLDRRRPSIRLDPSAIQATAEGQGDRLEASIRWRLPTLAIVDEAVKLTVGALEGAGEYHREGADGSGRIDLLLGSVTARAGGATGRLKTLRLSGDISTGPDGPARFSGALAAAGGAAQTDAPPVKATGFSARLPLLWPPGEKGDSGTFSLGSVTWNGKALGAVAGRIRQTAAGLSFEARHDNRLLPGLTVEASGDAGFADGTRTAFGSVAWSASRSAEAPALMLSELMSEPPAVPISFSGRLFARGEAAYDGGLSGSLTAGVEGGRIQVDDQGMVIEGIQTTLHITDLAEIRSAPAQPLTFDSVASGSIRAEDGRLAYQIEPGPAILIEGARFSWCGGTVIAPATRFVPGVNRYDLSVYCDRIRLDQLLDQLGLATAEGGGAISGLVPLTLSDGRLAFNNAFLYSTPGEGGVIRVQGSEVLTAGIPPGTPQYHQMELARYALKDYDYRWAKVTMNTVDDDLLVQLQFDGKPAQPLPFEYKPEAGGFVKAGPDSKGSIFQGIRLDVNVTLPLNRMLRYRELFKRFQ